MIGDVALVPAVIAQSGCHPLSCFAFFATSVNAWCVAVVISCCVFCVLLFVFFATCGNVAYRVCSVMHCWL